MTQNLDHVELVSASNARENIAEHLKNASNMGVRIGITKNGNPVAAIVPFSDVAVLEAMDEQAIELAETKEDRAAAIEQSAEGALALGEGAVDRLASYLTGQIAARIKDAKLLNNDRTFKAVQEIVSRSIHDTLDQRMTPNPPADVTAVSDPAPVFAGSGLGDATGASHMVALAAFKAGD